MMIFLISLSEHQICKGNIGFGLTMKNAIINVLFCLEETFVTVRLPVLDMTELCCVSETWLGSHHETISVTMTGATVLH